MIDPTDGDDAFAAFVAHATYDDQESQGAALATYRDEHLCFACIHQSVCVVVAAIPDELLVSIRRCRAFTPAKPDE